MHTAPTYSTVDNMQVFTVCVRHLPLPSSLSLVYLLHLELLLVVLLLVLGKVHHEQLILHRDVLFSVSIFKVLLEVSYPKVKLYRELWIRKGEE